LVVGRRCPVNIICTPVQIYHGVLFPINHGTIGTVQIWPVNAGPSMAEYGFASVNSVARKDNFPASITFSERRTNTLLFLFDVLVWGEDQSHAAEISAGMCPTLVALMLTHIRPCQFLFPASPGATHWRSTGGIVTLIQGRSPPSIISLCLWSAAYCR